MIRVFSFGTLYGIFLGVLLFMQQRLNLKLNGDVINKIISQNPVYLICTLGFFVTYFLAKNKVSTKYLFAIFIATPVLALAFFVYLKSWPLINLFMHAIAFMSVIFLVYTGSKLFEKEQLILVGMISAGFAFLAFNILTKQTFLTLGLFDVASILVIVSLSIASMKSCLS